MPRRLDATVGIFVVVVGGVNSSIFSIRWGLFRFELNVIDFVVGGTGICVDFRIAFGLDNSTIPFSRILTTSSFMMN